MSSCYFLFNFIFYSLPVWGTNVIAQQDKPPLVRPASQMGASSRPRCSSSVHLPANVPGKVEDDYGNTLWCLFIQNCNYLFSAFPPPPDYQLQSNRTQLASLHCFRILHGSQNLVRSREGPVCSQGCANAWAYVHSHTKKISKQQICPHLGSA